MFEDAAVPALPAGVEIFLGNGPPPVIFTPGSFIEIHARFDHARIPCDGCARDCEDIAAGETAATGATSPNVWPGEGNGMGAGPG
jgi:hypothetical protein